jgi:hypothetical protein
MRATILQDTTNLAASTPVRSSIPEQDPSYLQFLVDQMISEGATALSCTPRLLGTIRRRQMLQDKMRPNLVLAEETLKPKLNWAAINFLDLKRSLMTLGSYMF